MKEIGQKKMNTLNPEAKEIKLETFLSNDKSTSENIKQDTPLILEHNFEEGGAIFSVIKKHNKSIIDLHGNNNPKASTKYFNFGLFLGYRIEAITEAGSNSDKTITMIKEGNDKNGFVYRYAGKGKKVKNELFKALRCLGNELQARENAAA